VIEKPVRIAFLKKLHLFRGLNDVQLASVADELQEKTFDEAGMVFAEGSQADSLHFIFKGSVNISRRFKGKQVKIASLVKGDYYGEQGLIKNRSRNASVNAEKGSIILLLFREPFSRLLKKTPDLRANFEMMMSSRQLAQAMQFKWLAEDEIIYYLARKHSFLLVIGLLVPGILLVPIIGVMILAYLFSSATIGLIGGILLSVDILWAIWRVLDWENDYYIVTNQRVISLEKVIALYDSRTEAGMDTILSVTTETDYIGRIFDYGIVVVRTYTGQIRMTYVSHPRQAGAMIEEYWNRSRDFSHEADKETMKQALRNKLGFNKPVPPAAPTPAAAPAKPRKKSSSLSDLWKDAFRTRTENGATITYHKHLFILFRDVLPYALGILGLVILVGMWPIFLKSAMPLWLGMLIGFGMLVLFGFMAYEYLDWQNDIYQVTIDQIIDINRKPLGAEDRKAAPLENILSTEYKRTGLIGLILNFGTVYIMVGGAQFNFNDVADPPSVQQDIIRRQLGRKIKQKENEASADRERMSDWLAMYHRTVDEANSEKDRSGPSNPE